MDRIQKLKALSLRTADATADMALINNYTLRELSPEDVYCFSVILCDNEVDRDLERFTNDSLNKLADLFKGVSGLFDHRWSAEKQNSRIYRTQVKKSDQKNTLGEPLQQLIGDAYMLRTQQNEELIKAIEGGILKEVSIGCSIKKCSCSICKEPLRFDWRTWKYSCKNEHIKGETYDGSRCIGLLEDPTDAYEFSFVAVPSQRGAGVAKSASDIMGAFDLLLTSDISEYGVQAKTLLPRLLDAFGGMEDRQKRAEILRDNEKYLKDGMNNNG